MDSVLENIPKLQISELISVLLFGCTGLLLWNMQMLLPLINCATVKFEEEWAK